VDAAGINAKTSTQRRKGAKERKGRDKSLPRICNLMIDLNDFYLEGYVLLRANDPGWEQLKDGLLPDRLISLATCICPHLQIYWGWIPGNPEIALKFGVPQARLDEFLTWCKGDYQTSMDYVSMFYSTEAAREFVRRFLPDTSDLHLIGVGLHRDVEITNWHPYAADEPTVGIQVRLGQQLTMEPDGKPLGYEVVSFAYHDFGHSWLCNQLHKEMHALFGIRPNGYGLIESEDDARKVSDWIAEDEMKGTRAEPETYSYWLLVSYPLEVR
jgi:hypothetical protein